MSAGIIRQPLFLEPPAVSAEPEPCPRCSHPAPGPVCDNCHADTSKTFLKVRINK